MLLLEGEVNDVTCNGLIKSMLVLEHQSATEPITLIINSPGGSVTAGLALIDTMQSLDCPVITVGEGVVASMAAVILACGDRRQVYRHTQVLIHQLMGGTGMAQQTDIEIAAQHTAAMRAELDELLAERGNLSAPGVSRAHRARLLVQRHTRPRARPGGRGDCAQQEDALAGCSLKGM